jgi:hypothetical protein
VHTTKAIPLPLLNLEAKPIRIKMVQDEAVGRRKESPWDLPLIYGTKVAVSEAIEETRPSANVPAYQISGCADHRVGQTRKHSFCRSLFPVGTIGRKGSFRLRRP